MPGDAGVARRVCATRCNAFSGTTRHSGARLLSALVVDRGRARADAARRRRPDDPQLRAADARVARLRAGQPPGGADLPAAVEHTRTGIDRTRFYMDTIHRVGATPGVTPPRGVSTLPMYPVGHRLRAAVHHRRARRAHQRRGAAGGHPHGHARLLRDDEDRAAQRAASSTAAIARARPGPS